MFRYRHPSTLSHKLKATILAINADPEAAVKVNEHLTVHSLKKTYVSKLMDAGLSEALTHMLSHHKSFQTTLRYYAQFDVGKLREASERSRKTS